MAERSKCDLPYGHYGRVQFSLDDNNLDFGRLLTIPTPIKVLPKPNTPRRASDSALPKHATTIEGHSSKSHAKQTQALIKERPEFQPASNLLSQFLRVSEAVQKAAGRHEPAKGNLIAFVKVWSEIRHRSISVAALPTGESGSALRLVQVQRQRRGWATDRSSWLDVPILHGEETIWSSDEGPILQVHSLPGSGSHDALLAVRIRSKTVLFRPFHRKVPMEKAMSNLALDHLYSVGINETGGQAHADVAFNPWFIQQVAFVDHDGGWSVLEFRSRNMERVSRSWHGSTHREHTEATITLDDGWARISWILSLSTMVVCTRQSLALVTLRNDGTATSKDIELHVFDTTMCILDMMVMPESRDAFVVLTRTHVVLYQVIDNGLKPPLASVKAKIRHFKSPEDLTLRLNLWIDGEDTFVALLSSLHSPICVFRLRQNGTDRMACDTPFELALFEASDAALQILPLRDLHVQPLKLITKPTSSEEQSQPRKGTHFYAFTALQADYSVFHGLCYRRSAEPQSLAKSLAPPLWEQKLSTTTQSRLRREDFIVEDDDFVTEYEQQPLEPVARRARKQPNPLTVDDKTVNLELTSSGLYERDGPDKDIEELASEVAAVLKDRNPQTLKPMRTWYNMTPNEILTGDIQAASALLEQIIETAGHDLKADAETDDHDGRLQVKPATVNLAGLFGREDGFADVGATLETVYDQLVSRWITSLSAKVPGWVRLAKVDVVQRVAAETFLATQSLRLEEVKTFATQQSQEEEGQASNQTWELPVRASEPVSQPQSSTSRHISQHSALPTPSPTVTPSVITASSGSSISAAPELHRLSKYTTFEKPAPMVLPRPLVKVLSHWKIGDDPDNYDWLAASRHLNQQEDEEADQDMTEKERKRMQRRAERHILRQRKEAAASQASQLTNSQATDVVSASQPTLKVESQPSGMPGSSQSQGPSAGAVAASQVVPGRFGGRAPPRKRRKQGF